MESFVEIRERLKRKKKSRLSIIPIYVNDYVHCNQHFSCPHLEYVHLMLTGHLSFQCKKLMDPAEGELLSGSPLFFLLSPSNHWGDAQSSVSSIFFLNRQMCYI